jgi:hypothetical protein
MGKFFKVLLVFAVLIIGGLYGHYRYILKTDPKNAPPTFFAYLSSLFEKESAQVAEKSKEQETIIPSIPSEHRKENKSVAKPESSEKKGEDKTPTPGVIEIPPPKTAVDWDRVNTLRRDGQKAYDAADFEKSRQIFKELCDVLQKGGQASNPIFDWALRYLKRSFVFSALLSHIQRSELASGKDIYLVKLETGADVWVRIIKQDEDKVTVEKEGGIVAEFTRDRIIEMAPKKPEEYKNYLLNKFEERKRALPSSDYAGRFVHLVVFAKKYGLDEKITPLLEEIFSTPKSEILVQMFIPQGDTDEYVIALLEGFNRDAEARNYRKHSWKVAYKPPTPSPSSSADETITQPKHTPEPPKEQPSNPPSPEPGEEPPLEHPDTQPTNPDTTGSEPSESTPPGLQKLTSAERDQVEEARQLIGEVRGTVAKAMNIMGTPECFKLGKTAMEKVKRAQKIVLTLRNKYPDDPALETMEGEIAEMVRIVEHIFPAK